MSKSSLLTRLFDGIATHLRARDEACATRVAAQVPVLHPATSVRLLPSLGNVLFTALSIGALLMANRSGALALFTPNAPAASSTTIMAYQGRLANAAGQPLTTSLDATFRLYDSDAPAAIPLWAESWFGTNQVRVRDGLFSVNLGSIAPITVGVIANHPSLFLGITIGGEELQPRTQLGGVPLAFTVPDGAITSSKIADGSVTAAKLGGDVSLQPGVGSITTSMLANGSVTSAKLDLATGLTVTSSLSVAGNISLAGVLQGPSAYYEDYRPYFRFMKAAGATDAGLCPQGGIPVGVINPLQSLELMTGNQIAAASYPAGGSCINVHSVAPCGSIIGDHYPYAAESCSAEFPGTWAPYLWHSGLPSISRNQTVGVFQSGIGCRSVRYVCVQ